MPDRLVRVLCQKEGVVALACNATETAREGRRLHQLAPSSAGLLAEAFTVSSLVAALQKSHGNKVSLQVECDGPARGLFVDADPSGTVRGYVKSKIVHFPGGERFESAPMLGTGGYVAMLRERDGEFYKGMVALGPGGLGPNVEAYFTGSEQVPTVVQLDVLAVGDEPLGLVGGVLVQALPDGDAALVQRLGGLLRAGAWRDQLRAGTSMLKGLEAVLGAAGASTPELMADGTLAFACSCGKDRVLRALATLHPGELFEMIHEDHGAHMHCDFCGSQYNVSEAELQGILDELDRRDALADAAKPGTKGGGGLS